MVNCLLNDILTITVSQIQQYKNLDCKIPHHAGIRWPLKVGQTNILIKNAENNYMYENLSCIKSESPSSIASIH